MAKPKKKKATQRKKKSTPFVLRMMMRAGGLVVHHPGWVGGPLVFGVVFSFVSANALWYQPGPHPGPMMKTRQLADPYAVPGRHVSTESGAYDTFRIEREESETAEAVPSGGGDDLMAILEAVETEAPSVSAPSGSAAGSTNAPVAAPDEPVVETAAVAEPADAVDLLAVQTALAAQGYYKGTPDGLNGPMTEAAIRGFQSDQGLPETGTADARLAALVRDAAPLPQQRPDVIEVASADPVAALLADGGAPVPADPMVIEIQRGLVNIAYDGVAVDGVAGPGTRQAILEFQKHYRLAETGQPDQAVLEKLKEIGAL